MHTALRHCVAVVVQLAAAAGPEMCKAEFGNVDWHTLPDTPEASSG